MITNKETVRNLCKTILSHLEKNQAIAYAAAQRHALNDSFYQLMAPHVLTEEDLNRKVLEKLGKYEEALVESGDGKPVLADDPQYKTAKGLIRQSFGENELNGLYYQKNLRLIAQMISRFLMESQQIEEVYESDDHLETMIVETVKRFNPRHLQ